MNASLPILDAVQVASPCTVSWDEMSGDDSVRFCAHCQQSVYNLSAMSRADAEAFVRSRCELAGRTCIRFYRRHDGTLLTRDCPIGLAAVRRRLKQTVSACVSLAASLVLLVTPGCRPNGSGLIERIRSWWNPPVQTVEMGGMCPPAVVPPVTTPLPNVEVDAEPTEAP